MSNATADARAFEIPALNARTLATAVTAGAFATIAFDIFGQGLSPLFGFAALAPIPLAKSTLAVIGIDSTPAAHLLHYFAGVLAYAVGWMLIARPIARRVAPSMPWWVAATIYGVALWVFALFVMASLVAGMPPFLGFTGITWVALVGHIVYALVVAAVVEARSGSHG